MFLTAYREVLGEPPAPTDTSAILATIEQFVPAVRDRVSQPYLLVEAWLAGSDWVQPVLYLSQRTDVRAALPHRQRLLAAVKTIRVLPARPRHLPA